MPFILPRPWNRMEGQSLGQQWFPLYRWTMGNFSFWNFIVYSKFSTLDLNCICNQEKYKECFLIRLEMLQRQFICQRTSSQGEEESGQFLTNTGPHLQGWKVPMPLTKKLRECRSQPLYFPFQIKFWFDLLVSCHQELHMCPWSSWTILATHSNPLSGSSQEKAPPGFIILSWSSGSFIITK